MFTLNMFAWAWAGGTLGFLAYVQFSPSMGNIWYRCGRFSPQSAVALMRHPFVDPLMWRPSMWTINYPLWLVAATAVAWFVTVLGGKEKIAR